MQAQVRQGFAGGELEVVDDVVIFARLWVIGCRRGMHKRQEDESQARKSFHGLLSLRKEQSPLRLRNRPPQFLGSFDPFIDDDLSRGQGFLISCTVRRAARQFGDLCDKRIVRLAPVKNNLIAMAILHLLLPSPRSYWGL